MIDTEKEHLKLLSRASADVPGNPHCSTLIRWALRGVKGIKLETVVVGGRRFTSVEAIRRFIERLSVARGASPSHAAPTPDQGVRRVDDELAREGF